MAKKAPKKSAKPSTTAKTSKRAKAAKPKAAGKPSSSARTKARKVPIEKTSKSTTAVKSGAEKPTKAKPAAAEKPESKSEAKSEVKADSKVSSKPASKSGGKSAPAPKAAPDASKALAAKAAADEAAKAAAAAEADKKAGRKGITIVTPKPVKRTRPTPSAASIVPAALAGFLLKGHGRKPLIPSGPKAAATRPLGAHGGAAVEEAPKPKAKSPFGKKDLERFRQILLKKRAELVGDVRGMEADALQNDAGALSNVPSHQAEQGSDASDQSLSLDLAAADRKLIREIDAALNRIDDGTFGVCELSGEPIKLERLEELPWARYSIESARSLERYTPRTS